MVVLSFDGGGTKARLAVAGRDGRLVHAALGKGVNPLDNDRWLENLKDVFSGLTSEETIEAAVFGMPAFGEVAAADRQIVEAVAQLVPDAVIVNDVELAHYAAFDGEEGILLLAGTGSMAISGGGGREIARVGGLGDELGDEGSAFWIGRAALVVAAHMIDGRRDRTGFLDAIFDHLDIVDRTSPAGLLGWYYGLDHRRSACAALAHQVDLLGNEGDEVARSILDQAADELFLHARPALTALRGVLPRWSYAGGVFASAYMQRALEARMGCAPQQPVWSPLEGGLAMAARRLGWPIPDAWQANAPPA